MEYDHVSGVLIFNGYMTCDVARQVYYVWVSEMDTLRPQITHVVGKLVINTWNRGTLFQTNLFGRFLLALLTFRDTN